MKEFLDSVTWSDYEDAVLILSVLFYVVASIVLVLTLTQVGDVILWRGLNSSLK